MTRLGVDLLPNKFSEAEGLELIKRLFSPLPEPERLRFMEVRPASVLSNMPKPAICLPRLEIVVLGVATLPVAEEDEPIEIPVPPEDIWVMLKEGCLL